MLSMPEMKGEKGSPGPKGDTVSIEILLFSRYFTMKTYIQDSWDSVIFFMTPLALNR